MGLVSRRAALPGSLALLAALGAAQRCSDPRSAPSAPKVPTALNGIEWPELCVELPSEGQEEHFFIIGDWGGILGGAGPYPMPADDRVHRRPYVQYIDDRAQRLVAGQMNARAAVSKPQYILNVGDNFYWGGIDTECGQPVDTILDTPQWRGIFEDIYTAPELVGKPWMGVLGSHDYGGYIFTKGWDQAIAYTWGPSGRWLTPALYWSRKVWHVDFSVDYFFVDSNMNDAFPPENEPEHNMCSEKHNDVNATCGEESGPTSISDCFTWFHALWQEQLPWLEAGLQASTADWQIVVTHFPPDFQVHTWQRLAELYGIDLIVSGHRHQQEVHYGGEPLGQTAWVVSGGGGGVTSEGMASPDGQDDMYGFMDVTISKDSLRIQSISHGGIIRKDIVVQQRLRGDQEQLDGNGDKPGAGADVHPPEPETTSPAPSAPAPSPSPPSGPAGPLAAPSPPSPPSSPDTETSSPPTTQPASGGGSAAGQGRQDAGGANRRYHQDVRPDEAEESLGNDTVVSSGARGGHASMSSMMMAVATAALSLGATPILREC